MEEEEAHETALADPPAMPLAGRQLSGYISSTMRGRSRGGHLHAKRMVER